MNTCQENTAKCQQCSSNLPANSTFCPACGNAVTPSVASPLPSQSPPPMPSPVELTLGGQHTQYQADEVLSDQSLAPDTEFADRYLVQRMIGAGGMGMVYLASDQLTGTDVALKVVHPERTSGPNEVSRLVQEGITARNIRHPNVVAVYDVGEFQGQTYISMEYLDGVTLRTWLRQRKETGCPVLLAETVAIVQQILTGLQTAHAAQVIHRDLKPENIMVSESGGTLGVKLLDFGIAKNAQEEPSSSSGSTLGSQKYMAPEQLGSADLADESADLYAVGVIFYELLIGVVPQRQWQPPSAHRKDIPAKIDQLIERSISDYASARPQSATEFLNDLQSAADENPAGAESDSAEPSFWDQAAKLWPKSWQEKSDWKSKPLATKIWVIVIILLVIGIFAADLEDGDDEESGNFNNGPQPQNVVPYSDPGGGYNPIYDPANYPGY